MNGLETASVNNALRDFSQTKVPDQERSQFVRRPSQCRVGGGVRFIMLYQWAMFLFADVVEVLYRPRRFCKKIAARSELRK